MSRLDDEDTGSLTIFLGTAPGVGTTRAMLHEAVEAGFYDSKDWGTKHPRIQILTIEELLAGKNIDRPQGAADATFKRAPKAKAATANMNLPLD